MGGMSNSKRWLSCKLLWIPQRLSWGPEAPGAKQWRAVLRTGQVAPGAHSRMLPLPSGPASAGSEQLSQWWGHKEGSQCRLCFPERSVRRRQHWGAASRLPRGSCAGATPGHRHSTKKKTRTTSRTTKRTAMAHHWRRSGRQDTRVSTHDSAVPKVQSRRSPEAERGQNVRMTGAQRLRSCPGGRVSRPALHVWPRLLKRASCKYKLCSSSLSLKSVALGLLLVGTMSLERCWYRRSRSKPAGFHPPPKSDHFIQQ